MEIKLKGRSKYNENVVLDSAGMHAILQLLNILWKDKTMIQLCKVASSHDKIIIETTDCKYEIVNVPLEGDGQIDIYAIYKNHINDLKEKGVI